MLKAEESERKRREKVMKRSEEEQVVPTVPGTGLALCSCADQ